MPHEVMSLASDDPQSIVPGMSGLLWRKGAEFASNRRDVEQWAASVLLEWREHAGKAPVSPTPQMFDVGELTDGEKAVWFALEHKCLNREGLSKRVDTSLQTVAGHVAQIRKKFGTHAIKTTLNVGYWRPDAPPDWQDVKPPRRKRRIGMS